MTSEKVFESIPIVVLVLGLFWFLLCALLAASVSKEAKDSPSPNHSSTHVQRHGTNEESSRRDRSAWQLLMDRDLFTMNFTSFLIAGSAMMFVPLLPVMVQTLHASTFQISFLSVGGGVSGFLFSPVLGYVADAHGRVSVLIQAIFFCCLAHFAIGIETNFWLVLVARSLSGCFHTVMGVCNTIIAERTTRAERSEAIALAAAAQAVGGTIAPGIAGAVSPGGHSTICFVMAGALFVNTILLWSMDRHPTAKEMLSEVKESDGASSSPPPTTSGLLGALRARPAVLAWLLVYGIQNTVLPMVMQNGSFFLKGKFKATEAQIGLINVIGGVALVVTSVLLVGPLSRRMGELPLFIFASLAYGAMTLGGAFAPLTVQFVFVFLFAGISACIEPTLISMVTQSVPRDVMGTVLGIFASLKSIGFVGGGLIGGALYQTNMYAHFVVVVAAELFCALVAVMINVNQYGAGPAAGSMVHGEGRASEG